MRGSDSCGVTKILIFKYNNNAYVKLPRCGLLPFYLCHSTTCVPLYYVSRLVSSPGEQLSSPIDQSKEPFHNPTIKTGLVVVRGTANVRAV